MNVRLAWSTYQLCAIVWTWHTLFIQPSDDGPERTYTSLTETEVVVAGDPAASTPVDSLFCLFVFLF